GHRAAHMDVDEPERHGVEVDRPTHDEVRRGLPQDRPRRLAVGPGERRLLLRSAVYAGTKSARCIIECWKRPRGSGPRLPDVRPGFREHHPCSAAAERLRPLLRWVWTG